MRGLIITLLMGIITNVHAEGINILQDHKSCNQDSDCDVLYTRCDFCECPLPINKNYLKLYNEMWVHYCNENKPKVTCDAVCFEYTLVCISGKCNKKTIETGSKHITK